MLKLEQCLYRTEYQGQPPLGGCVLKLLQLKGRGFLVNQPPLGGCVLKPLGAVVAVVEAEPAAFRRLCVETSRKRAICRYR